MMEYTNKYWKMIIPIVKKGLSGGSEKKKQRRCYRRQT